MIAVLWQEKCCRNFKHILSPTKKSCSLTQIHKYDVNLIRFLPAGGSLRTQTYFRLLAWHKSRKYVCVRRLAGGDSHMKMMRLIAVSFWRGGVGKTLKCLKSELWQYLLGYWAEKLFATQLICVFVSLKLGTIWRCKHAHNINYCDLCVHFSGIFQTFAMIIPCAGVYLQSSYMMCAAKSWKGVCDSPKQKFFQYLIDLIFFHQVANVVVNEVDFNPEFISRMIPKVEWSALLQAAEQVQCMMAYKGHTANIKETT